MNGLVNLGCRDRHVAQIRKKKLISVRISSRWEIVWFTENSIVTLLWFMERKVRLDIAQISYT